MSEGKKKTISFENYKVRMKVRSPLYEVHIPAKEIQQSIPICNMSPMFSYKCCIPQWVGHVARIGEERGVYRFLLGKPEERILLGRPRRRWVDNIRMDLQEVGCGYMEWIGLAQDRDRWRTFVSAVMNLRVQ